MAGPKRQEPGNHPHGFAWRKAKQWGWGNGQEFFGRSPYYKVPPPNGGGTLSALS